MLLNSKFILIFLIFSSIISIMNNKKSQISIRLKKNTDVRVIEFINMQSNLSDTILYLIEKEIAKNGIRNLQMIIPAVRNILPETLSINKPLIENIDKQEEKFSENNKICIPDEYID